MISAVCLVRVNIWTLMVGLQARIGTTKPRTESMFLGRGYFKDISIINVHFKTFYLDKYLNNNCYLHNRQGPADPLDLHVYIRTVHGHAQNLEVIPENCKDHLNHSLSPTWSCQERQQSSGDCPRSEWLNRLPREQKGRHTPGSQTVWSCKPETESSHPHHSKPAVRQNCNSRIVNLFRLLHIIPCIQTDQPVGPVG